MISKKGKHIILFLATIVAIISISNILASEKSAKAANVGNIKKLTQDETVRKAIVSKIKFRFFDLLSPLGKGWEKIKNFFKNITSFKINFRSLANKALSDASEYIQHLPSEFKKEIKETLPLVN